MRKIVFIIESVHLGGAEKTLITLLQNLDYSQYKVDLITFKEGGIFRDLIPAEVNSIVLNFPKLSLWNRLKFLIKKRTLKEHHTAQLFWPIIKKYFEIWPDKYDIAISYNQGFSTYFASEFIQAERKFAWLNTNYKLARYNIKFDYKFYKKFDKVVCVSNEVQMIFNEILTNHNLKLETITIKDIVEKQEIVNKSTEPIDEVFNPTYINIVSVGRLAKPKAFDLAIDCCHILICKGYKINWFIIGEGQERSMLEQKINKLNLVDNFFLLGAKKNPYPYVSKCDIFVQTSIFEGLGTTLIEASLLNKPIVTTNFPSAYSIIKHEETGLICEMDANAILEQIERLIVDQELRQKLVSNLESQENNDKNTTMNQITQLLES
jgi:glycosyltransferase involved in cell wall biosynthesis